MPKTWLQFKTDIRSQLWPDGEPSALVTAHDKFFLDAIVLLQQAVPCLQTDNTDITHHCATYYQCGLTVFTAPRGHIKKVTVVDKVNATTGLEDSTAALNYCCVVECTQIKPEQIRQYLDLSLRHNYCLPALPFFGLYYRRQCPVAASPAPTDVGLAAGLAPLPLGYHYPQASTDRTYGRAPSHVWAIERGKIFMAPWIQSTESVIVAWDGVKRVWNDADPIDDDPQLAQAVSDYVLDEHERKYGHDYEAAAEARIRYANTLRWMIHECREETRVRDREPSLARGSAATVATQSLYYNDRDFTGHATCPSDQTGAAVDYTVPAGSVGSSLSVADANQMAQDEANAEAQARLVCQSQTATYKNTAQTATASCVQQTGCPKPDGAPVTVTIPADTVTSTVSQADADTQAHVMAQTQASSLLHCTFYNKAVTVTKKCPDNPEVTVTKTIAAKTYSSTVSQADADAKATAEANNQANSECGTVVWNTEAQVPAVRYCPRIRMNIMLTVTVPAHTYNGATQLEANQQAMTQAYIYAQSLMDQGFDHWCAQGTTDAGTYILNLSSL